MKYSAACEYTSLRSHIFAFIFIPVRNFVTGRGKIALALERAVEKGHTSLMKEAHKFAEELGIRLSLEYPQPSCRSVSDPETEIKGPKMKEHLKKAARKKLKKKIKWHGRFLQAGWQDSELSQSGCFAWLRDWTCTPSHTIAGVMEVYEQLTATKVYKTGAAHGDVTCRLCGKSPETLAHVSSRVLCSGPV